MTAILGIDAAWTPHGSTGISLVAREAAGWRCVAVAPGYQDFLGLASMGAGASAIPPAADLLAAAGRLLGGRPVDLVTVDMPLSTRPITARREADNAISRAFGARGCSCHSPSATRPGPISDRLRAGLAAAGYPLATTAITPGLMPAALEVYPHLAAMALLGEPRRVPYKLARSGRYWPGVPKEERASLLLGHWRRILAALQAEIADIPLVLPATAPTLAPLKPLEDQLDALVCAWVGMRYLQGRAAAYGDEEAAVWVAEIGPLSACGEGQG